jgi:hypothetical protein
MYVYQIDDAAFDLLKWRSQETNVKPSAVAEPLLADVRTVERDEDFVPSRAGFDRLLLSSHQRGEPKPRLSPTMGSPE